MGHLKKTILPILLTGIWLNISGTIKWIFFIESYWIEKYKNMKLVFPTELINNITWMIWGFLFATTIFILSKKFNLIQTTLISWFVAYVMMWVIVWNVGVLPTGMLWINVPLSLFEAFIGALICKRLSNK
ncbi:MAG: hypothetical protein IMY71_06135 [Bacteroidetes bacterium]|nr:hypothetical protein [Bacteroidota bacterium]